VIQSCLYQGTVRHRRFEPVGHAFRYSMSFLYLDLDELESGVAGLEFLSRRRRTLASFYRPDHLGEPSRPLRESVLALVARDWPDHPPIGPIRLLTLWRSLGTYFSPVSFYYGFDPTGTRLEFLVAEVSNTPWGERHNYVLPNVDDAAGSRLDFDHPKVFHVSPFLPIDMHYRWQLTVPTTTLSLHLETCREDRCLLDATLTLRRRPLTRAAWLATMARYPWLPARVLSAIYWQALRLWIKKVPFYPHPPKPSPVALEGRGPLAVP
jgi:DUF1365 family protein